MPAKGPSRYCGEIRLSAVTAPLPDAHRSNAVALERTPGATTEPGARAQGTTNRVWTTDSDSGPRDPDSGWRRSAGVPGPLMPAAFPPLCAQLSPRLPCCEVAPRVRFRARLGQRAQGALASDPHCARSAGACGVVSVGFGLRDCHASVSKSFLLLTGCPRLENNGYRRDRFPESSHLTPPPPTLGSGL